MYLSHVWMYASVSMLRLSLGSWIKPLGFDLCQRELWDSFAMEGNPKETAINHSLNNK
jgi:hypothetical protein